MDKKVYRYVTREMLLGWISFFQIFSLLLLPLFFSLFFSFPPPLFTKYDVHLLDQCWGDVIVFGAQYLKTVS